MDINLTFLARGHQSLPPDEMTRGPRSVSVKRDRSADPIDLTIDGNEYAALRDENKRLREALEWYACEDNYDDEHAPGTRDFIGYRYDRGAKARAVIDSDRPVERTTS